MSAQFDFFAGERAIKGGGPVTPRDDPRKLARRTDPDTSHRAAAKVAPKLSERRREVLEIIEEFCPRPDGWNPPNPTCGEITKAYIEQYHDRFMVHPAAVASNPSKRINELIELGYLRVTGERKVRGYGCRTYEITTEGREALK